MTIVERMKEYLDAKGILNAHAEKACGFSNGLIGNAIKNGTTLRSDSIEKFMAVYKDLSAEWLLRGAGSMLIGGDKAKELEHKIDHMSQGGRSRDAAYDIVIGMIDVIGKTYDFYKEK